VNRAAARRVAAVLSATALAAGAAAVIAAPSAHAAQAVTVVSQSSFVDSVGTDNIVGEVRNDGSTDLEQVTVDFSFMNAANQVLGTDSTNAMVERLAPGEKSPFLLTFSKPAGYDHSVISVTASDAAAPPNHNFTTALPNEFNDGFGLHHIAGTVRNDNTIDADFVNVVLTFYNAGGQVVDAASEFVDDDTIAPGATSTIDETISTTPAYASYTAVAQSNSDSMPGATPAPSPTSSPNPSSSPSPAPGTEVTPTVTLGSSSISAGQQVTVTYHGAPNTTLKILSKTQPATAYSVITAVALDAAGNGASTHAPTKNTRIMAQTQGGLSSVQPLIQVRSVASLNAKRVGTKTYTFSGRAYPALNNRLVSIYRSGSLVAQARCNASGIYTVTRTLAAGTFSFQARTANDTYNLGATSPAHAYRIS
jgi:hypothetical protein